MINANDLRIGNWIMVDDRIVQVANGNDIDLLSTTAMPIAITQELLFAMGFVQRRNTTLYDVAGNNFAYQLGADKVTIYHPGNQFWYWLGSKIQYVHQIQNLFYCIVGFDLTLQEV